jgi:predicted peroxiredoxin
MSKRYFVQISTDPDVDPRKCAVGMACAAQAVTDGHFVNVFFASHAVKLLQAAYIDALDERVSQGSGQCLNMLQTLIDGTEGIYCSTGSQAVVGVNQDNAHEVLVGGYDLNWSGPPGVVSLSSEADVVLTY